MTTIDKKQLQFESLKLFEKQFNTIEKQIISYIHSKYLNESSESSKDGNTKLLSLTDYTYNY